MDQSASDDQTREATWKCDPAYANATALKRYVPTPAVTDFTQTFNTQAFFYQSTRIISKTSVL